MTTSSKWTLEAIYITLHSKWCPRVGHQNYGHNKRNYLSPYVNDFKQTDHIEYQLRSHLWPRIVRKQLNFQIFKQIYLERKLIETLTAKVSYTMKSESDILTFLNTITKSQTFDIVFCTFAVEAFVTYTLTNCSRLH